MKEIKHRRGTQSLGVLIEAKNTELSVSRDTKIGVLSEAKFSAVISALCSLLRSQALRMHIDESQTSREGRGSVGMTAKKFLPGELTEMWAEGVCTLRL